MKKILGILAIFTIVSGFAFAQSITVYNEIYSRTVEQNVMGLTNQIGNTGLQRDADADLHLHFWGIRNRSYAKIDSEKWGVEARYQLMFKSNHLFDKTDGNGQYDTDLSTFVGTAHLANFWYKPFEGLTLFLGNDYGRQVAAAGVTAWDGRMGFMTNIGQIGSGTPNILFGLDPTDPIFNGRSARYASDGLTVEVTAIPNVKLAFNLPAQPNTVWHNGEEAFAVPFNAAVDVNILNMFDVGAVYKGGFSKFEREHSTMGIYADFVGVKGLKIQAGWTGVVNPNTGGDYNNAKGATLHVQNVSLNGMNGNFWGEQAAIATAAAVMEGRHTLPEKAKDPTTFASLIDIAGEYKLNNGILIAAAAEMGLGYDYLFPLTVAAYVDFPNIVDTLGFSTRITWESLNFVNSDGLVSSDFKASMGYLRINPNLRMSFGANAFEIGANFGIAYETYDYQAYLLSTEQDAEGNYLDHKAYNWTGFGFNIPVQWRHYF